MSELNITEEEFDLALGMLSNYMEMLEQEEITNEDFDKAKIYLLRTIKAYRSQEGCSGFPLEAN